MAPNERRFKSKQCHVCRMPHGERFRLELERASGVSAEALSRKYKVSVVSVRKHWKNRVSDQVKAELVAGPVEMRGALTPLGPLQAAP
jgi:hypothetical protein